jgi:hypothetical protein
MASKIKANKPRRDVAYRVAVSGQAVLLSASHFDSLDEVRDLGQSVSDVLQGQWPGDAAAWLTLGPRTAIVLCALVVLVASLVWRGRAAPWAATVLGIVGFGPIALGPGGKLAFLGPLMLAWFLATATCAGACHAWFGRRDATSKSSTLSWAGGLLLAMAVAASFILWHQMFRLRGWPRWDRQPVMVLLLASQGWAFVGGLMALTHAGVGAWLRTPFVGLAMILAYLGALVPTGAVLWMPYPERPATLEQIRAILPATYAFVLGPWLLLVFGVGAGKLSGRGTPGPGKKTSKAKAAKRKRR